MMVMTSSSILLLTLLTLSAIESTYASSQSLPNSTVCRTERCSEKFLTCPSDCPTTGAGTTPCFIDCWSRCQAICRNRKPECDEAGAICHDPRFVGGDGVMFYFHGRKDEDFCIVTDRKIHINAHFIGKRPAGRPRDYTWVQSLGMLFDSHKLVVGAAKVATWDDSQDNLEITFDGENIYLPHIEGALWASPSADVVVERMATANIVHVVVENLLEATLSVVPITEHESLIHNYQITEGDCFAHLQMQFYFLELSNSVDGVLGQTYQPGFTTPIQLNVPMPVMVEEDKYFSSSLLSADCGVNQFWPHSSPYETEPTDTINSYPFENFSVQCQSSGTDGMNCRREETRIY